MIFGKHDGFMPIFHVCLHEKVARYPFRRHKAPGFVYSLERLNADDYFPIFDIAVTNKNGEILLSNWYWGEQYIWVKLIFGDTDGNSKTKE